MSSSPLQDILVRNRLVTPDQIRHAVSEAHTSGATWLEQLILWRAIDEESVVRAGFHCGAVPRCDLDRLAKLPYDVVGMIPSDLCTEHRLMPLWVEADGDLRVAMIDPCDETAMEELTFFVDRPILREVAPASAIAWALHRYHNAVTPLWTTHRDVQAAVARTSNQRARVAA